MRIALLALASLLIVSPDIGTADSSTASGGLTTGVIEPVLLNPVLAGSDGYRELPPWPNGMVLSGGKSHSSKSIYSGEISVSIYQGTDELVKEDSHWVDEFVQVLHGEAILTSAGGGNHHFKAGDFFIVPKGWRGTWETKQGYKELVVVEASANEAAKRAMGRK